MAFHKFLKLYLYRLCVAMLYNMGIITTQILFLKCAFARTPLSSSRPVPAHSFVPVPQKLRRVLTIFIWGVSLFPLSKLLTRPILTLKEMFSVTVFGRNASVTAGCALGRSAPVLGRSNVQRFKGSD
jgi:hypothetical protein